MDKNAFLAVVAITAMVILVALTIQAKNQAISAKTGQASTHSPLTGKAIAEPSTQYHANTAPAKAQPQATCTPGKDVLARISQHKVTYTDECTALKNRWDIVSYTPHLVDTSAFSS
ncbi:hypothetical protein D6783_02230 [Candidatus Woesearchaeota archaeon]|nr:MAG: hypothetical protein D6783_02230 [Candidatus Woesearchaeota archaeon]